MLEIKPDVAKQNRETIHHPIQRSFHSSFQEVYKKLLKWTSRFQQHEDHALFDHLFLFYLTAGKKHLDHRNTAHLSHLVLTIHFMQKKLLQSSTLSSSRHLEIQWISTSLFFPFSSKPVLGCVVGFNLMDRYELFDEENVFLVLQKHFPQFKLVKESSYSHISSNKDCKIFYFEIEKSDGSSFCLRDRIFLKKNLEQKLRNSVQKLSPLIFTRRNEEEIYKNILVLSQQIHSTQDLPQALLVFDEQTRDEIIFLVTLVYISPAAGFSLQKCFARGSFTSERVLTVRYLENHAIEAHIFRIHLPRQASLLRSDGSLDFYFARQKVVDCITNALGEFRDYNGGLLVKQQELLQSLKEAYPQVALNDSELLETFFYSITPIEKQALLQQSTLSMLFSHFLASYEEEPSKTYSLKSFQEKALTTLILHTTNASLKDILYAFLKGDSFRRHEIVYNLIEVGGRIYFQCVLFSLDSDEIDLLIRSLQEGLDSWDRQIKNQQILKIGFEYSLLSLDPRIGGEGISQVISGMLFEGLTRFDETGNIQNGIAHDIKVSADGKAYTFYLRPCVWSDGSYLTAYDFEYAWKKVLAPDFKTAFAYLFYPIKGARKAKEGQGSMDTTGIKVIDERTLKVELSHPTPYFLELTSHPIYSPIHRLIDQKYPQWPYQADKNYPCNGAFLLKVNHTGEGYKLEKNPHYWDASNIMLDQVIFNRMTPYQAFQAFRKGEIDWLGHPLGGWHGFYTPEKEDRIVSFPNGSVCWYVFNTSHGFFRNHKLRQALALAIQRSDFLIDAPLPITPAYSPLLPQHSHAIGIGFTQHNVEVARRLWQEGWDELGFHTKDIPPLDLIFHHKGIREHVAYHLQRQLKEYLGVHCNLHPLPWNVLFERMSQGNFQMGLMQWSAWVNDPIYTLNAFRSALANTNFSKWEHPDFQALLDHSDQEVYLAKRFSYFAKAEAILCREVPVIPLFYQPYQALIKNNLQVSYNASCASFNFARSFF